VSEAAPDDELVAALHRGDASALDVIYERYRARVFSFLARLCASRPLAEDLMQETFIRLATSRRELTPDTRLASWLFRTGRNLWVDHRRRTVLDFDRLRDLFLWPGTRVQVDETPFDMARAGEVERRVETALSRVPDLYREALLLIGVEGLSAAEAARVAGVPDATMRKRWQRGREILEEALAHG
jgi:RNA polymerase sigma factor (sigma-70 family)